MWPLCSCLSHLTDDVIHLARGYRQPQPICVTLLIKFHLTTPVRNIIPSRNGTSWINSASFSRLQFPVHWPPQAGPTSIKTHISLDLSSRSQKHQSLSTAVLFGELCQQTIEFNYTLFPGCSGDPKMGVGGMFYVSHQRVISGGGPSWNLCFKVAHFCIGQIKMEKC